MSNDARPQYPLTVFYDGSCPICSGQMADYRERTTAAVLRFVDISRPEFDASRYGRSRRQFMKMLHLMDAGGRFYVGVDALRLLWAALPDTPYRMLAALLGLPGIHLLARIGYRLLAPWRHYLPPFR